MTGAGPGAAARGGKVAEDTLRAAGARPQEEDAPLTLAGSAALAVLGGTRQVRTAPATGDGPVTSSRAVPVTSSRGVLVAP